MKLGGGCIHRVVPRFLRFHQAGTSVFTVLLSPIPYRACRSFSFAGTSVFHAAFVCYYRHHRPSPGHAISRTSVRPPLIQHPFNVAQLLFQSPGGCHPYRVSRSRWKRGMPCCIRCTGTAVRSIASSGGIDGPSVQVCHPRCWTSASSSSMA